jgi:hypothetical protein
VNATATRPDLEVAVSAILQELPPSGTLEPALRALHELGRGSEIMPMLRDLGANHASALLRFQAERLLKVVGSQTPALDLGSPPEPARILAALGSGSAEIRMQAVKALRFVPDADAFPPLLAAIREEPDHWVLSSMISLVGLKGKGQGPEAAEVAAAMVRHTSPRVAANALLALFALDPARGVAAARERLDDEDPRMRASAVMATFTEDPDLAWSRVLDMLASDHVWMRTSGSYLAAKLAHDDSERALLEALVKEDDPALVLRTLAWFGRSGTAACVETLELIARLGEERYRPSAQRSLVAVRERIRTHTSPERPLPPQVLESGFNLTNAIPVISEDSLGNPIVRTTDEQDAIEAASLANSPVTPFGAGQPQPEEGDGEAETSSISRSTDTFLKSMVDEELDGPIPPPAPPRSTSLNVAAPVAAQGDRLESLARTGSLVLLLLIGLVGAHALVSASGRTERRPDPAPEPATRGPVGELTAVRVLDGRLDLNSQPRAGTEGRWVGVVSEARERRLVLLTDAGVHIPFWLQEAVELPPKGNRVILAGKVYRKAREGITLAPGARLVPDAP